MKPVSFLIVMFSLCLMSVDCDAGKRVKEEVIERSAEFAPGGRLTIVNVNGDVTITSWDRHEVKLKAVKRARAESEEAARLLLEKTTVRFDRTEQGIDIRTDAPKKPGRNRNVSVAYQPVEKVHPGYGRPLRSKYCVARPRRIAGWDSVARLVFGHNGSASPAERLYQRTAMR